MKRYNNEPRRESLTRFLNDSFSSMLLYICFLGQLDCSSKNDNMFDFATRLLHHDTPRLALLLRAPTHPITTSALFRALGQKTTRHTTVNNRFEIVAGGETTRYHDFWVSHVWSIPRPEVLWSKSHGHRVWTQRIQESFRESFLFFWTRENEDIAIVFSLFGSCHARKKRKSHWLFFLHFCT